jgi:hypothetical protein
MDRLYGLGNFYLEQNPVDLAQLPCATMPVPDGKRKEHYLEQLPRNAELECLHAKTVEPTIMMEQYIEFDDELPDLTGTSSPTPTLTSTSTSASTTSSDRRKTRSLRQTRIISMRAFQ